MNNPAKQSADSPRERILAVASDLFYRQGYRATGINEVIEKSGVAKATFYHHFPSKDDLARAYLELSFDKEMLYLQATLARADGPLERLCAVLESLGPWLVETDFRGCVFINMASEVPDPQSPLRQVGIRMYSTVRARVEQLSRELIDSDPEKYAHLDVQTLVEDYMLRFVGAIALAEIYHDIWPFEQAARTVRRLVGE